MKHTSSSNPYLNFGFDRSMIGHAGAFSVSSVHIANSILFRNGLFIWVEIIISKIEVHLFVCIGEWNYTTQCKS